MKRLVQIGNTTVDVTNNDSIEFENALCKYTDPEIFFPTTSNNGSTKVAINICNSCDHQVKCAAYALIRPDLIGIWGGLTSDQRRKMRRKHGITGLRNSTNYVDDVITD
jgi:WhiB family redox-sensing transcriptional regulator